MNARSLIDSSVISAILNYKASKYKTDTESKSAKYKTDVEAETAKYRTDTEYTAKMNELDSKGKIAALDALVSLNNTENKIESDKYIADLKAKNEYKIAKLNSWVSYINNSQSIEQRDRVNKTEWKKTIVNAGTNLMLGDLKYKEAQLNAIVSMRNTDVTTEQRENDSKRKTTAQWGTAIINAAGRIGAALIKSGAFSNGEISTIDPKWLEGL